MTTTSPVEDHRGVDVAQIRALLQMSPAERLAHMLEVAQKLRSLVDHARRTRE
ncbi:MAG: major capsid protein [Candidatus Nanopelagicales bacterium]|nr:major capsid protein [Candidatus Nanopelagicales bacterium]